MLSNFTIRNNRIVLKNDGEYFGALHDFEYPIGDKLYEFAIMDFEDFDRLKDYYTQLIDLVCTSKECGSQDDQMGFYFVMFQYVKEILKFSPYTHFYTQTLIDIIIKTYNSRIFRTDLLFKYKIPVFIENRKYYQDERFEEITEDEYVAETCLYNWIQEIDKVSKKQHKEYMEFFYTIRDLLIDNFMEKKSDLKRRLELISEYSNNSLVRNLSVEDRIYLYEAKRVFDLYYVNTKPSHSVFLDTKFTSKYIYDTELSIQEKRLDVEDILKLMKEKNIKVEEVFEIDNPEDQISFEIFKVIKNNFTINKCENCGRLFIPATTSNNPYQKGRNDQKYCNNLYKDTGKTCKEIGAINKRKEKVENSTILQEYNREYKRMHRAHYTHTKEFKEKKFKEWSKKARQLRDSYTDEQIEVFKVELMKLSDMYWKTK